MNPFKFISLLLLVTLVACQVSRKTNTIAQEQLDAPNIIIEERIDTFSYVTNVPMTQDVRDDTIVKFRIIHSPENSSFVCEDLKGDRRKEVIYDSVGTKRVTYWFNGIMKEQILISFNENGKVHEIETYKMNYDTFELFSTEEYTYSGELLKELHFKDFEPVSKYRRETIISYNYDDLGRKETAIVKTVSLRYGKGFETKDSDAIRYFYHDNDTLPYEVHRTAESGAKCIITNQPNSTFNIEKRVPYEDGFYLELASFTFDNKNRVVEYLSSEQLDPQEFTHVFKKYEITYPDDSDLTQVPNLAFLSKSSFPKRDIGSFIESTANPGFFKDAQVRTDIGYYCIPKNVQYYRSSDGENWTLEGKLGLHE